MVNSPPCPTCSWGLRWLPEQGAWGCDRCRKVVPAQPPAAAPPHAAPPGSPYAPHGGPPQAPYSPHAMPHGPGHAMPPPGAPRSMKGLAIGLGVGMVAVTGVIIALVVARGGGGGRGSREALVKGTLAAMSAGDVDKLVELSDPVGLHAQTLDCSERDQAQGGGGKGPDKDGDGAGGDTDGAGGADEVDDPQIQEKRIRRQAEKLVEKTKGMKLELVSIAGGEAKDGGGAEDKGQGLAMKKGDKALGCVLKVDVAIHELVAKVKVKVTEPDAGEPSEQEVTLSAINAGGSWYLQGAPKVSGGGGGGGGGAITARLRGYKDQMCACKDAACAEKVQADAKAWGKTVETEAKKLSKEQDQALEEIDEEMTACRRKLLEGDADGDADGDAGGDVSLKEVLAKLESYKAKMCACADLGCAARVQQDMASWYAAAAAKLTAMKTSPEEDQRIEALMEAYGECAEKLAKGDGAGATDDPLPPEEPPPGGGTSGGGGATAAADLASVPACADHRRQLDRLLACPKYPRSATDAMRKGYEQMAKAWAASAGDPAGRGALIKACEQSADALKKLVASMCP
jgi:hypothetical protein